MAKTGAAIWKSVPETPSRAIATLKTAHRPSSTDPMSRAGGRGNRPPATMPRSELPPKVDMMMP